MSSVRRGSIVTANTHTFAWPKSGNPISKEKKQQGAIDVKQFVLNARTANNFTQWEEGLAGCDTLYDNYNTGANNTKKNTNIAKEIKTFIDEQKNVPLVKPSATTANKDKEEKGGTTTTTTTSTTLAPAAQTSSSAAAPEEHKRNSQSGSDVDDPNVAHDMSALTSAHPTQSAGPTTTTAAAIATAPNSSSASSEEIAAGTTAPTSSSPTSAQPLPLANTNGDAIAPPTPQSSNLSAAAAAAATKPDPTLPSSSSTTPSASSTSSSTAPSSESKTPNYGDLMTAFDTQIQPVLDKIAEDDELNVTQLATKLTTYRDNVKAKILVNPADLNQLTIDFNREATDIIRQAKGNDHILHGLIAGIVTAALTLIAFVVGMVLTGTPIGLLVAQPLATAAPIYALGTAIGLGTITGVAASLFSRSSQTAPVEKVLEAKDTFEAAVNTRRAATPPSIT